MPPLTGAERVRQFRERQRTRERIREDPDAAIEILTRAVIAIGLATLNKTVSANRYASDRWDDRGVDLVLRAAVSPHTIASTPELSHIVVAFLDALVPLSAGADLLQRGIQLNFNGAAQITVPNIAIPNAKFVAEATPIAVVAGTTAPGPSLTPHKLATITTLTSEMMNSGNAETLVRQALIESTGPALDVALFSNTAGDATRPPGLLFGITGLTPAAAGEKAQAIVDDIQTLATAVAPVAGNGNIVLVASSDAAVALELRIPIALDWPILISSALAPKTVICVAANAIVSAVEGSPQIDATTNPSIHMADPAAEAVDIGGVTALPFASLYQSDKVGLRLRWPISWALRTPQGISWMQNVNW
jgi:hypothetical protein